VDVSTSGEGDAGTITIDADSVTVSAGGGIFANTFGSGNAGTIRIDADHLGIRGSGPELFTDSDVSASSFFGDGDAGTIELKVTDSFELLDGGKIQAQCNGITNPDVESNGGEISIEAGSVLIRGAAHFGSAVWAQSVNSTGHAGTITIDADSLTLSDGGNIYAASFGSGNASTITIDADSLTLSDGGNINAASFGSGNAGTITIHAEAVRVSGGVIAADAAGEGAGGTISIDARTVRIERQGGINASSGGMGTAGTIDVRASESILLTGAGDPRFSLLGIVRALEFGLRPPITGIASARGNGSITLTAPEITLADGALVLVTTATGDAGDILLAGERIYVQSGALVDSTSFVPGGNVGNITLEATERIEVVGARTGVSRGVPYEDVSRVTSASLGSGEGGTVTLAAPLVLIDGGAVATTALPSLFGYEGVSGGDISVTAGELIVRGGGRIDASSFIAGPGGNIDVSATDSILVEGKASDGIASGISSRTGAGGPGGAVTLRAPVIELSEGGEVSAKSEADTSLEGEVGRIFDSLRDDKAFIGTVPGEATGNAGTVTLAADEVRLFGGTIATNAEAADGGSITIEAKDLVHLDAGVITAAVRDGAGGNITIDPEVVILQNGSRIVADAGTGSGGNIQITADNYFAFPGSVVDASSELGIDGIVEVSTPDVDLAGQLTALPASFLDAASLMKEPCAARRSGERAGSFAVRGNGGIPPEPDGWLPGTVSFEVAPGSSATSDLPVGPGGVPLFALGSCR
jgi:large exoprotein involved in heme utilization and adhesion